MAIHLDDNKRKRSYDTLGLAIKHFRKKQGLTQCQLGQRIGVCQSSVAHYERNFVTPPLAVLKKISRELGCSLALLCDHKLSFTNQD